LTQGPVFWGKRSLQEYCSQTKIILKGGCFPWPGLIFLALTFSLAFFSPLYDPLITGDSGKYRESRIAHSYATSEYQYREPRIGLVAKTSIRSQGWILIPSFRIKKWGDTIQYLPQYLVYDQPRRRKLTFYFERGPQFFPWIELSMKWNPLFRNLFPHLTSIRTPRDFSTKEKEEFQTLVENALKLDWNNLGDILVDNLFFIQGPVFLRRIIKGVFEGEDIEKIKLGDQYFLRFREDKGQFFNESFLSLFSEPSFVMRILVQDKKFSNEFLSNFFSYATWGKQRLEIPFGLEVNGQPFEKFAVKRLDELAKKAISSNDILYQEILLESLERFTSYSQVYKKNFSDSNFSNSVKDLKRALWEKKLALKRK
jgi:hypothetical protein